MESYHANHVLNSTMVISQDEKMIMSSRYMAMISELRILRLRT